MSNRQSFRAAKGRSIIDPDRPTAFLGIFFGDQLRRINKRLGNVDSTKPTKWTLKRAKGRNPRRKGPLKVGTFVAVDDLAQYVDDGWDTVEVRTANNTRRVDV